MTRGALTEGWRSGVAWSVLAALAVLSSPACTGLKDGSTPSPADADSPDAQRCYRTGPTTYTCIIGSDGSPGGSDASDDASALDAGDSMVQDHSENPDADATLQTDGPLQEDSSDAPDAFDGDGAIDEGMDGDSSGCAPNELACAGGCVASGAQHCGRCDNDCTNLAHASGPTSCVSGQCELPGASCAAGWADCDGIAGNGCETDVTQAAHCGSCNNACGFASPVCAGSGTNHWCMASCPAATPTQCGAQCVDTSSDVNNCGACATACMTTVSHAQPACHGSTCEFDCNAGYTDCGGACVDEQSDSSHCGGCDIACAGGEACTAGSCVCPSGTMDCNGVCVPDNQCGTPISVAGPSLGLWLTADRGITCATQPVDSGVSFGRVTRWADQSGLADDAILGQAPPQLGPQCHIGGSPHVVNGVDLPYFSAPNNGNVVDETLDVDLGFLKGSDYTIFAVARRWGDVANYNTQASYILGTSFPPAQEGTATCASAGDTALQLGYSYTTGTPLLWFDQACDGFGVNVPFAASPPPDPLFEVTISLDQTRGREIWIEGVPQSSSAVAVIPLHLASGGAIGRAVVVTTVTGLDLRFRGDIAEVVVYRAALSNPDRTAVEAYLKGHWRY